jgi:DNA polymerase III delta prime subunit
MNHILWVEKYRPHKISDCVLPPGLRNTFAGIVKTGTVPNLILSGSAGVGKTTVAKAICDELDLDYIFINASDDRNIDTIRNKVKQFASAISFKGKRKVVIFDEADFLNPTSSQPALRGIIEEFSENCSFIFTCNHKNKIIPAIHSRTSVKDFKITKAEKQDIFKQLFDRIKFIFSSEKIAFDSKIIAEVIALHYPDYRRIIHELQTFYLANGEINSGILSQNVDLNVQSLVDSMKSKDFSAARQWVVDNLDNDSNRIFRKIYDSLKANMKPSSIPQAILYLADYQYKSAFSVDQEICILAFIVQLMSDCEWN